MTFCKEHRGPFFFRTGVALLVLLSFAGCRKETVEPEIKEAYIIDSAIYGDTKAYNFAYPSSDPYGNPTMISGTITMGKEVTRTDKANGILLYNRYTIFRADQCPSRGSLDFQKRASGSGLIVVTSDHYGFGITEDMPQAYCHAHANAQTSVDALLAAEKLLKEMGFEWNDVIFNVGYSQGGQTAMGVVRLVAERYPSIGITYTFAGGGPYSLLQTYRGIIEAGYNDMPCTVVGTILAFNYFGGVYKPFFSLFTEPLLSNVDDWITSKRYTRQQIDKLIGSKKTADYLSVELNDLSSSLSQQFMRALDADNLCKGWTPRGDERVMLVHNKKDTAVPVACAQEMYQFLLDGGAAEVDLRLIDIAGNSLYTAHEAAGVSFLALTINKISEILGISPWVLLCEIFEF